MNSKTLSRRSLLKAMAATSAVAVLAACVPAQSGSAPAAAGDSAAPAADQTTVRLLTTHGATMAPFIAASLDKFAAAHPEIKVEHEDLTEGYYDRLNVMLASNTLPDVVNLRCYLTDNAAYAGYGAVKKELFSALPPASTAVIVKALLLPDLLMEIEATAFKPR